MPTSTHPKKFMFAPPNNTAAEGSCSLTVREVGLGLKGYRFNPLDWRRQIKVTDLSPSILPYPCGPVDLLPSPLPRKKAPPPPRPCPAQITEKPRPEPRATARKPTSQKPQVPPKPAHLLELGQDKRPKRIPPAPCRPLPTPPPKPRTCQGPSRPGSDQAQEPQTTTSTSTSTKSVCLLIEKFENSRVPILGVQQRPALGLFLNMEAPPTAEADSAPDPGSAATGPQDCASVEGLVQNASERSSDVPELSEFVSLRVDSSDKPENDAYQDCIRNDMEHNHSDAEGDHSDVDRNNGDVEANALTQGSNERGDSQDVGETEANGKIPNRDSGIDSPSCGAEVDVFQNEDTIEEEERNDSVATETESVSCLTAGNKRDSTQDEDSDLDEGSSGEPDSLEIKTQDQKLLNIAKELLQTEEAYVKRLNLLDQVFCTKLTEAGIPGEVINGIFSNISSIYLFHHRFLLPELQTRITQEWSSNPRIGDILQKLAPFMKMYGEYVKNFDRAMDLVNTWTQRSTQFKSVVQNIQKQDVCGNLTLQHHMLEPVQRIPRYELLLKDYLKKLPDDTLDRKDAEKALDLISTAANHSNAAIRKMEKMHKLLEVYERLGGEEDIVNPANELIKEGHIKKMSAKNGTAQDRYLYLFNNMVLYCVPKLRLMGQKFSVRERIDIAGMEVQENVKQNLPHSFAIIGKQRSLELQARTAEEKEDWIQVILATIERHKQNSETFKAFNSSFCRDDEHILDSPGPWISTSVESDGVVHERKSSKRREKEKETCKGCNDTFNFTKRKHHCKSCGAAICGKCSKVSEIKGIRLCKHCYEAQLGTEGPPVSAAEVKRKAAVEKQPSLSEDGCVMCSYLQVQEKGKTWTKSWVAITKAEPLVLYVSCSVQDSRSARAIPLPGYEVSTSASEKTDAKHVFRLSHSQHALLFSAPDVELMTKWVDLLSRATRGEATETSVSLTEHGKSQ
ncbi:faciogenital dysplasia [Chanos chanos]|uniref:Faciogenital dysplasia n=1 Tax=Chanos chanos TaxID=29144 RepID=A0A6J2W9U9_CHACN|nr:FYVE, RhoGEF and PH domain-containing protein 3-like [Chanos chanos]